ncbi:MAG: hypothetical protein P8Y47_03815 [Alphaproteobacteria bacterium]
MSVYRPYVDGGYATEVIFVRVEDEYAFLKEHEDAEEIDVPVSELYVRGFEELRDIPEGKIVEINAPYKLLKEKGLI